MLCTVPTCFVLYLHKYTIAENMRQHVCFIYVIIHRPVRRWLAGNTFVDWSMGQMMMVHSSAQVRESTH